MYRYKMYKYLFEMILEIKQIVTVETWPMLRTSQNKLKLILWLLSPSKF